MTVRIARERPDQPAVIALIDALGRVSAALYPAESNHLLDVDELLARKTIFCVARRDDVPVACGAVVIGEDADGTPMAKSSACTLIPTNVGRGLGAAILAFLEAELLAAGVDVGPTGDRHSSAGGRRPLCPHRLSRSRALWRVSARSAESLF